MLERSFDSWNVLLILRRFLNVCMKIHYFIFQLKSTSNCRMVKGRNHNARKRHSQWLAKWKNRSKYALKWLNTPIGASGFTEGLNRNRSTLRGDFINDLTNVKKQVYRSKGRKYYVNADNAFRDRVSQFNQLNRQNGMSRLYVVRQIFANLGELERMFIDNPMLGGPFGLARHGYLVGMDRDHNYNIEPIPYLGHPWRPHERMRFDFHELMQPLINQWPGNPFQIVGDDLGKLHRLTEHVSGITKWLLPFYDTLNVDREKLLMAEDATNSVDLKVKASDDPSLVSLTNVTSSV